MRDTPWRKTVEMVTCNTCGKQWVSSYPEGKPETKREPFDPPCPKCNGKMRPVPSNEDYNLVNLMCSVCGHSDGKEYCPECKLPKELAEPIKI